MHRLKEIGHREQLNQYLVRELEGSEKSLVVAMCDVWEILSKYNPAGTNYNRKWTADITTKNFYTHSIQTLLDVESFEIKSNDFCERYVGYLRQQGDKSNKVNNITEDIETALKNLKLELRTPEIVAIILQLMNDLAIYTSVLHMDNGIESDAFKERVLSEINTEIKRLAEYPVKYQRKSLCIVDEFHLMFCGE